MKKINKVLSLILAIVMIVSMMPMAFAAGECEHKFNEETMVRPNVLGDGNYVCQLCGEKVALKRADYSAFDDIYVKVTAYYDHVYANEQIDEEVYTACDELWEEVLRFISNEEETDDIYNLEYSIFNMHEGEQDNLDNLIAIFNEFDERIKAILAKYENPILFDGTVFSKGEYYLNLVAASFTDEEYNKRSQELVLRNPGELQAIMDKYEAVGAKIAEDRNSVTKEECDEAMTAVATFFVELSNCIAEKHNFGACIDNGDGTHKTECNFCIDETNAVHIWGEYVSNNDATTEVDGTKTAVCVDCGATDTVIDEGSKLEKEEEKTEEDKTENDKTEGEEKEELSFFESVAKMFADFFESIKNFFKNLFK